MNNPERWKGLLALLIGLLVTAAIVVLSLWRLLG